MKKPSARPGMARLGAQGRLVLPSEVREAARLKEGDELIVVLEEGGIRLLTPEQAVQKVQEMARKYRKKGGSVVADLLRERREEAERG